MEEWLNESVCFANLVFRATATCLQWVINYFLHLDHALNLVKKLFDAQENLFALLQFERLGACVSFECDLSSIMVVEVKEAIFKSRPNYFKRN